MTDLEMARTAAGIRHAPGSGKVEVIRWVINR